MAQVERINQVLARLKAKEAAGRQGTDVSVVVGYTQAYAVYVHEDLAARHPKGGQAKFLEQPMRQLRTVLARIVTEAVRAGRTLGQALVLAGLRLQRESQQLCPVDTGALRASAFTQLQTRAGQPLAPPVGQDGSGGQPRGTSGRTRPPRAGRRRR